MYLEIDEKLKDKIEKITSTDYDFKGNFLPSESITSIFEDLICEIYRLEEKYQDLEKDLEEKLKNDDTNEENMNCIYLSDKPNYWYSFSIQGTYNWNKILKDNNKTPKLVEKALTDDKALKQLCNLKEKDSWRSELGCVNERIYNYLFKGRNGLYSVIETNKDCTYMYDISNSDRNYLTKDECEEIFKHEMIKEINYYLKNYKDKFEVKNNE